MMLCSCDDTTDNIGMSLTDNVNNISISADSFFVESHSVKAQNIVSRSAYGLLGKIKDPETKSYVTCNYMTQYSTMGEYQFPSIDDVYVENFQEDISKLEQIKADSCKLAIYFSNFYGDSLALMKVMVHEMSEPYEEGKIYKSDFDPVQDGMIRTDDGSIHKELSYTISNRMYSDADRASSSYVPSIIFSLNDMYQKDGMVYNNYGTYLMKKFYGNASKELFTNVYKFTHNVCPGFYIENIGGIGTLGTIQASQIVVYFSALENGKKVQGVSSFGGSEDVIRKTYIKQDASTIDGLIASNECTYLKTPAGIFTELSLPIDRIMLGKDDDSVGHDNDSLNTVRLFIPRVNNEHSSDYNISIPKTLLLLPTDSIETFFAGRKIADSQYSFLSTYSSTSNGYTFGNISKLITNTYKSLGDTITEVLNKKKTEMGVQELSADVKQKIKKTVAAEYIYNHPTWNKVTLIPVETTYSTLSSGSSILTKVIHDMKLGSTRLAKGSLENGNISVNVIYSKFKE